MCGIIAITTESVPVAGDIIYGLKALEYRGYDSAGAVFSQNLETYKTIQALDSLQNMISHQTQSTALGHTRWATHGKICVENTHPIRVRNACIVHNGILENYQHIRAQMKYNPKTATDTEILLAALLHFAQDDHSKENILRVLGEIGKIAQGSYACAILFEGQKEIYWAKRGISPLIAAKYADGSGFALASDECAINKDALIYDLPNDAFGVITPYEIEIISHKETTQHALKMDDAYTKPLDKSWLEIEIAQQEKIYERESESEPHSLDFSKYDGVLLIGCGSAYIAATIGSLWLEEEGIRARAEIASEWNCRKSAETKNTLAIFISQSGETADTLLALQKAKEMNLPTLAIVNKENSTIAKAADSKILLDIGIEQSVASTKAFTTQLAKLFALAKKKPISSNMHALAREIMDINISSIALALSQAKRIMLIGKNVMYSIAMEGALKMKELTYQNVDAYASSELKHGYIALVDENTYAIGLLASDSCYLTSLSNLMEIKTRAGKIVLLAEKDEVDADYFIKMPGMSCDEHAFICVILLQRLACEIAKIKHLPIDRPRNLAKSITVI